MKKDTIYRYPGYLLLLMFALLVLPMGTMGLKKRDDSLRLDLQSRCLKKPFLPECRGSVLKRAVQNSLSLETLFDWAADSNTPTHVARSWNMQTDEALHVADDNKFVGTYEEQQRTASDERNQGNMLDRWFRLHHVPMLRRRVSDNNDKC